MGINGQRSLFFLQFLRWTIKKGTGIAVPYLSQAGRLPFAAKLPNHVVVMCPLNHLEPIDL